MADGCTTMLKIYRVSQGGRVPGRHFDSVDDARDHVRGRSPGHYDIDVLHFEPDLSRHHLKAWGRMIRHPDGEVEDDPWAQEA